MLALLPKPTLSGIQKKKLIPSAKVGHDASVLTVKGFMSCKRIVSMSAFALWTTSLIHGESGVSIPLS